MSGRAESGLSQAAVVRGHFDEAGARWARRYGRQPRGMADLDLILRRENLHRLLRPVVAGRDKLLDVLDVGCGSGDVLDGFPRDGLRVTGVDFAPEMTAAAARAHPMDRFLVGDAECLPVAPDSADVIICLGALEYVSDVPRALASMVAALRRGGCMIVSFPNRRSVFRKILKLERGAERIAVFLRDTISQRDRQQPSAAGYRHRHWSAGGARRLMAEAGLKVDEIVFNTIGPWGRLGRTRIALTAARQLSNRLRREGVLSGVLASTMVVRAEKTSGEPRNADRSASRGHD
ncbi:MAG: class I SAM-dependent methyltransferase [Phycisphaerae bacterium]